MKKILVALSLLLAVGLAGAAFAEGAAVAVSHRAHARAKHRRHATTHHARRHRATRSHRSRAHRHKASTAPSAAR